MHFRPWNRSGSVPMKRIIALIKPNMLDAVIFALHRIVICPVDDLHICTGERGNCSS